jgi:hypothetical protein
MTWKDTFKVYWMKERNKETDTNVSFSSVNVPHDHLPFWRTFWLDWPWSITFIRASCSIENRLNKIWGIFLCKVGCKWEQHTWKLGVENEILWSVMDANISRYSKLAKYFLVNDVPWAARSLLSLKKTRVKGRNTVCVVLQNFILLTQPKHLI